MLWKICLLVILSAVPPILCEAHQGFATPPPGVIEQLSRHHHRRDRLRITTDSARFEVRSSEIGTLGLSGLVGRGDTEEVPDTIPWSSVARLDQVRSRFRIGQVVGFAAGFPIGLGFAFGTGSSTGGGIALVALGTFVGASIGGRLGDLRVRERTLYESTPVPDSAALASEPVSALADSTPTPAATAALADSAPPAWHGRLDSLRIARAVRRIRPNQFLRIRGEFGQFEGFVARASVDGLAGLRPSRKQDWNQPWPRELGWERIGRIDQRGNSAGHGALIGAAVIAVPVGVIGLAVGAAVSAYGSGSGGEVAAGALIGVAIGGAIGGVFGALIGSAIPRWHMVYGRQ